MQTDNHKTNNDRQTAGASDIASSAVLGAKINKFINRILNNILRHSVLVQIFFIQSPQLVAHGFESRSITDRIPCFFSFSPKVGQPTGVSLDNGAERGIVSSEWCRNFHLPSFQKRAEIATSPRFVVGSRQETVDKRGGNTAKQNSCDDGGYTNLFGTGHSLVFFLILAFVFSFVFTLAILRLKL
jgi:hypothetical protein